MRTWAADGPPPLGRFDEAKVSVSEGKYSERHFEAKTASQRRESKFSESKADAESKVSHEYDYKDGSIFVDDLETGSEESSDEDDRFGDVDDEDSIDEQSVHEDDDESFQSDASCSDKDHRSDCTEEESIFDTDLEDTDEEEEEEEDHDDDHSGHESDDSSLSSNAFVEQDLEHLKKYVGLDVVVCFGEAWLRGTVSRFQPNDGRLPTKKCGLLIEYAKAESEWLRDIQNDPDVQVLENSMSAAQKFNSVEVGDPVIGLYNASCWCPGVIVQKLPASADSDEGARLAVRFENGQSGQCACDEIVVVRQDVYKTEPGHQRSEQDKQKASPSSWSSRFGDGSSSDDDSRSTSSSSDDDESEEFTGHRRVHTPKTRMRKRRPSKQSIEFSWQQHGQSAYRPQDGPPKDSESTRYTAKSIQRDRSRMNDSSRRLARFDHGGSGRNLLKDGKAGSRENLLHDPQKLLALPLEELVEGGFARQVLSDHTRSPRMELERIDRWSHCKCRYEDAAKQKFYLYDEVTGELLLTAKRIGTDFYISQYPDFPDLVTKANVKRHIQSACGILHYCEARPSSPATSKRSRLRTRSGGRIARCQLWSTSCDYCDNALAKYVCGPTDTTGTSRRPRDSKHRTTAEIELDILRGLGCRQLLADFTQANTEVKMGPRNAGPNCATVEARRLTIAVPTLGSDPRTEQTYHCGWCDRCPRDHDTTLQLVSTVPEWNDEAQRLTMCFEEGYVRDHSTKNFLIHEVPDPLSNDKSPKSLRGLNLTPRSPRKSSPKALSPRRYRNNQRSCLQFGKSSKRLFTLSYRYPMSAMQGFGIALSHFNWMPDQ